MSSLPVFARCKPVPFITLLTSHGFEKLHVFVY